MVQYRRPESILVLIYTSRHEILLLKRIHPFSYWQSVTGSMQENETKEMAALRELKEETGFEPVRMFVADHVSKFYETHEDRINLVPVFGIEVDREDVKISEEHCDFKWVDFETARDTLVWKGQKEGITAVNNMLNSNDNRIKWSEVDLNTKGPGFTK